MDSKMYDGDLSPLNRQKSGLAGQSWDLLADSREAPPASATETRLEKVPTNRSLDNDVSIALRAVQIPKNTMPCSSSHLEGTFGTEAQLLVSTDSVQAVSIDAARQARPCPRAIGWSGLSQRQIMHLRTKEVLDRTCGHRSTESRTKQTHASR